MKIFFSCALAFVLSLMCLPNLTPFFGNSSSPSTITAAGWPTDYDIDWYEDDIGRYTYLGNFPQSYVGDSLNAQIALGVQNGSFKRTTSGIDISSISPYPELSYVAGRNQILMGENESACADFGITDWDGENRYDTYYLGIDYNLYDAGTSEELKYFYIEPIKWYDTGASSGGSTVLVSEKALYANFYQGIEHDIRDLKPTILDNCNVLTLDFVDLNNSTGLPKPDYIYENNALSTAMPTDYAIATGAIINPEFHVCNYLSSEYNYFEPSTFFKNGVFLPHYFGFDGTFHAPADLGGDGVKLFKYGPSFCVRPMIAINEKSTVHLRTFDEGISNYPGITKKSDGYHITDFSGFQAMSDFTNAGGSFSDSDKFFLDNDIDCKDKSMAPIKAFSGTLDGQGHSIINLLLANNMTYSDGQKGGMFIETLYFATIENINFINCITFGEAAGALFFIAFGDVTLSHLYREGLSGSSDTAAGVGASGFLMVAQGNSLTIDCCSMQGNVICFALENGYTPTAGCAVLVANMSTAITITNSCFIGHCSSHLLSTKTLQNGLYYDFSSCYYFEPCGFVGALGNCSENYSMYWDGDFSTDYWTSWPNLPGYYNHLLTSLPMLHWNLSVGKNPSIAAGAVKSFFQNGAFEEVSSEYYV